MNQRFCSQKTPHTSPSRASYGMSFVKIWVKVDRVITAPPCILIMQDKWVPVVETKFGMHSSFRRVVGHLHLSEPEFYSSEKKVQILVYNSPARPKAILRKEERWLTDVGHNSWRHMKSAQHAAHTPNSKSWDYSDMPGGGIWKIKGPTYPVDGSHQDPNPHPHLLRKKDLLHQEMTMLWLPYLLRNNPHIKEFIDYMYLVNNFVIWGLNFQIYLTIPGISSLLVQVRAGVKYVLSNTNTNTNTKIWIFQIQIQIQIFCSSLIQIQIQIQIHRFKYKYKYKYVQPNISAENCSDPK